MSRNTLNIGVTLKKTQIADLDSLAKNVNKRNRRSGRKIKRSGLIQLFVDLGLEKGEGWVLDQLRGGIKTEKTLDTKELIKELLNK